MATDPSWFRNAVEEPLDKADIERTPEDDPKRSGEKELGHGTQEKVTKVIDGATVETASQKNPVRLANVDAAEKGQPGTAKATEALRKLIQGEEVIIDTVARDRYDRPGFPGG